MISHSNGRRADAEPVGLETIPSGSVFTNGGRRRPYLVAVMSWTERIRLWLLIAFWLAAQAFFWTWWLRESHVVTPATFLFNTALISWFAILPAYYLFFLVRMKKPNPRLPVPEGLQVAMVVTKAPSEPWSVVRETLLAMLGQDYPHDNWLADEDPTPEVLEWCERHDVYVSSRKGVSEYHRPSWPRRTRCKEGNLAYFYDHYGYENYDIVVQLDADHRPAPGYLREMLRPFADPEVGYVSAPSICDINGDFSWATRARLYAESTLHGSLQAGYNDGWAPLCIGSHYAVRTEALWQIGGLGPELAEDHSTTLMMNAGGWKGVHAFDAEAHGDGPLTFGDCMTQEFQWSRSLTILLLDLLPRHWRSLKPRLKAQFLFSELWYPLFAVAMLAGYLAPIVALATQTPLVSVSYVHFIAHTVPLTLSLILIILWVRSREWVRPKDARVISWESAIFQLTRWPWILAGCAAGAFGTLRGKQFEFRVTPKQKSASKAVPFRLIVPYFIIAGGSILAALLIPDAQAARGYYYLVLVNSFLYTTVIIALILLFAREAREASVA